MEVLVLGLPFFEIKACVISYYDNKMSKLIVNNSIFLEGHKKQTSKQLEDFIKF